MQLLESPTFRPEVEPRIVLQGVTWEKYEALLFVLGEDHPALRLTYLQRTLEIMTTSLEHEQIKKMIARLLEIYALEQGVALFSCGAATFRKRAQERGLEPDESYCLDRRKEFPDLAIEVVITHGVVDRLEVYRGLGIPELWIWQQGQLTIQHLNSEGAEYQIAEHSRCFPELDLTHFASFVQPQAEPEMIRSFRDSLR